VASKDKVGKQEKNQSTKNLKEKRAAKRQRINRFVVALSERNGDGCRYLPTGRRGG
jgi:hypothetical protein